jgi:hypothetical protein
MSLRRLLLAASVAAMTLVPAASAQEKNELAVSIGRTFISNQGVTDPAFNGFTVHFGKGLTFVGNYGRHVLGENRMFALTLEVPFAWNPDEDLHFIANLVPEDYGSYFITPSARVNVFAMTKTSPWVSFGGGFGHFHESDKLEFFGDNPGKKGTTSGVLQIGVGIDIHAWDKFSVRGEVRDFYSGVPQLNVDTGKTRQHNYFVGGGVVWHF